jgi:hypothetical protein
MSASLQGAQNRWGTQIVEIAAAERRGIGTAGLLAQTNRSKLDSTVHDYLRLTDRASRSPQSGEVLVSRTGSDLVAGSGISFADRGVHPLRGVPGTWQTFAVEESIGS